MSICALQGPFLPAYESVHDDLQPSYGLHRLDHAVGNAPKMGPVLDYLTKMTGWHQFAEFTAEDVGTLDSGTSCVAPIYRADWVSWLVFKQLQALWICMCGATLTE